MNKRLIAMGAACVLCASMSTAAFALEGDLSWEDSFKGEGDWESQNNVTTTPVDVAPVTPVAPLVTTTPDAKMLEYVVQKGDTLSALSINFYGNLNYGDDLYRVNRAVFKENKDLMLIGMKLQLPLSIGNKQLIQPAVAGAGETLYTVQRGDTLSKIAKRQYGNASLAYQVYERNSDRLANVNRIYTGQIIVLPALAVTPAPAPAPVPVPAPSDDIPFPGWEG